MKIIRDGAITVDNWQHYNGEGDLPDGDVIVSLAVWTERKEELSGRSLGLLLEPDQHPSEIKGDLEHFALIAINFPSFADGRGYSYAKILRDRYGFEGEIRAVGDVLRDQLFYMQRCGFNAYEMRSDRSIEDALKGLEDFTVKYQVSHDEKLPLYRRR